MSPRARPPAVVNSRPKLAHRTKHQTGWEGYRAFRHTGDAALALVQMSIVWCPEDVELQVGVCECVVGG